MLRNQSKSGWFFISCRKGWEDDMEQLLLEFGLKDGIFVGLFIWLLFYVLNTSKEREAKLTNFLDEMRNDFAKLVGSYEKLSSDVTDIKDKIEKGK